MERYVCYCSQVTEEDIRRAVKMEGADSIAAVIRITGAMSERNCREQNPKGVCCFPDLEAAYLAIRAESDSGPRITTRRED